MRYITIAELNSIIRNNLWRIPHDVNAVVGVPRSGMLPAAIIAGHLNTLLSDIDSFVNEKVFECGKSRIYINTKRIRKVLVVDDSVDGGDSINEAKNKLKKLEKQYEIIYASPFVRSHSKDIVDIYFEIIDDKRIFEWNLMHHGYLENACLDIDGVLCKDPEIDDDGDEYRKFLCNAMPLFTPKLTINTLITCRLEKYRGLTENWLAHNNIRYKHLIMLSLPDKETRIKWARHGEYKGDYFKNSETDLFIESSPVEADTIARISGKPVICTTTNELVSYNKAESNGTKNDSVNNVDDLYTYIIRKIFNLKKSFFHGNH